MTLNATVLDTPTRVIWPGSTRHCSTADRDRCLDIAVDDSDATIAFARSFGATLAASQPQDHVRVYVDSAGHPFCLFRPQ